MTINLHDTTDAAVWAAEFCKIFSSAPCRVPGGEAVIDGDDFEEIMHGWFASAIMAGVDSEARKAGDPATIRAEVLRDKIAAKAREYAEHYPQSSDGRNTFLMFADWVEALALIDKEQDQ